MRYLCTIRSNDGIFTTDHPAAPTSPSPVASVVVSGSSPRQAAARAYVKTVGHQRASRLRQAKKTPAAVVALETSPKAIAASLRKVHRRFGECYEMDNYHDVWSIQVESVPMNLPLPSLLLYHLSRSPFPN
jgi:hypothetical protein